MNEHDKVSEVLKILREKGIISISRSALYRYKNNYFSYSKKSVNEIYRILYETGNINLVKSLEKTIKVYKTHKQCVCSDIQPRDLRRYGRIYLHRCGGWVNYLIATHIINRERKSKPKPKYHLHIATARSY